MRSFWGLMRAYWFSDRWKEAWGLTLVIALLTALSSKASVWMAEASGELVNSIAFFHDPANVTPLASLLTAAGTLFILVLLKDAGFTGIRHLFSTTLHRKWRGWLDGRFNAALLDANHTHFHVQHDAGEGRAAPDNIDQRVQDAIKGMTGGAIGLAMGVMSVATSLFFVGQKLWETSAPVRGLEFLGDYGSFVLALGAVAAYVPLNTFIAMKLGGLMERLNVRMQQAEGSYRGEMNTLLRRSFHVAASRGEGVQQAMHERHYRDIDKTWARLNTVNAGYMSFELIYNFVAARFIAYGPGLIPYMQGQINLKGYVTGAELVNSLIGQCSWFIQVMPAIATLRANSVRVIDLAEAIENVQQPQQHYGRTGQAEFRFASQHAVFGLALRNLELMHRGSDVQPFLTVTSLRFRRGEWSFVRGESGCGKTSLVKAINGLWPYGRGDIVFPENVSAFYATQDVKLPQVTLKQLVCLPGSAEGHSEAKVAVALHKAGLGDFIEHLDSELHDGRIWEQVFSGGQKQKLVAARILLHQPGLLFLDEATGALDHEAKIAFHRAIKDNCPGVTVISVMHDPVPPRAADGSEFYDSIVSIADGTATKQAISSLPAELTTLLDQPLPVRPWPKRGQRVKLTDR
ncbi:MULTISPECIES: ABC transporter ATP-binding protein/permease [Hyphomicrobiales]|jgi:putative ATP-binding cassette transporter|uniref:ABC transporter ATP-binding protein/permease n=1 Tax=Hyphomicrobiales TaxID=356 RepID=UPI0003A57CB0|nr:MULTISPECIES: ABC transporter ATP-binding protein/permease [Phyllobacteriaceae]MCX8568742.1 ABC transporter ATP-binding protein/permease [Aminobacter sp. MET-1]